MPDNLVDVRDVVFSESKGTFGDFQSFLLKLSQQAIRY
jgi:hypothetical protein